MPWDSIDKWRHEDFDSERRKGSRRRFRIGGKRSTDNKIKKFEGFNNKIQRRWH